MKVTSHNDSKPLMNAITKGSGVDAKRVAEIILFKTTVLNGGARRTQLTSVAEAAIRVFEP
jgi:hypothetical protein